MTTLFIRNSNPATAGRCGLLVIALVCFALAPVVRAVTPAPDGGYPGNNTAEGTQALQSRTTGVWNTALGFQALFSDTTGNSNTATGQQALFKNVNGANNTATGVIALFNNTGTSNTATGWGALNANTSGNNNTATGVQALAHNTTGSFNTATGFQALQANTADGNTAYGYQALTKNTTGFNNNAVGDSALFSNTTGLFNNAHGVAALFSNTTKCCNDAFGDGALANSTGSGNTAIGDLAGVSLITGDGNVYVGASVFGVDGENNTTRISNIYETVQPAVGTDPDFVTVNSSNRLGRGNVSSRRYKHDIKPIEKASEGLFKLKPVSFRYKEEFDRTQTVAFGLIAEDVAEVYPELVGRNPEGQPESVRYEQINAMLLNEFLKEHRRGDEQDRQLQKQQQQIEKLTAQLKKQAAQIQKVNDKVEISRPAATMVENEQ